MYMLDTNICIYLVNQKQLSLAQKIVSIPIENICISVITQAELEYGIAKSKNIAKNAQALVKFLSTISVLNFDTRASEVYGEIRADLELKGCIIGPMDMLIAAHAKSKNFVLVTNNVHEFYFVDGLQIENWVD